MKKFILVKCLLILSVGTSYTQKIDQKYYGSMKWRMIGPRSARLVIKPFTDLRNNGFLSGRILK